MAACQQINTEYIKDSFHSVPQTKHKKYKIVIEINNIPIEQVRRTKFLCVIFDDNLDWSNHISYINTKIAKGIGIICRAKKLSFYYSTN